MRLKRVANIASDAGGKALSSSTGPQSAPCEAPFPPLLHLTLNVGRANARDSIRGPAHVRQDVQAQLLVNRSLTNSRPSVI
eukprot:1854279-Amphidinium_carterae.1